MNKPRKPLIAGNWKMFKGGPAGLLLAEGCVSLSRDVPNVELVIAPPFTVLAAAAAECEGTALAIAGQNLHAVGEGPYTGEVSGPMLIESGCTWVIIGHSERRQHFGETDRGVAEKAVAAYACSLLPILCVGETLAEREAGHTIDVVHRQVTAFLEVLAAQPTSAAIAYEPVWAIGTGKTAGPHEAEEVHHAIRGWLANKDPDVAERTRILYGGSVKPDNATSLLACPNVDGALVGGASLEVLTFGAIARAAEALAVRS